MPLRRTTTCFLLILLLFNSGGPKGWAASADLLSVSSHEQHPAYILDTRTATSEWRRPVQKDPVPEGLPGLPLSLGDLRRGPSVFYPTDGVVFSSARARLYLLHHALLFYDLHLHLLVGF